MYYYDTPLTKGQIRRGFKRIQRKYNRRNRKNENKAYLLFCLYGISLCFMFCYALLNSPTMIK